MSLYLKDESGELWWCNSHHRRATHINHLGDHCCAPWQGGITIPCMAVNLTGIAEITEENSEEKQSLQTSNLK